MPRRLQDSVVVITGASSGIGRASALEFARRCATVLVAARREAALRDLVAECEGLGGRALAVPTDVTEEGAVQRLACRAVEAFGRLDVWVNNAAVTLFSRFEEAPPEVYRRVIETNLFGCIHGARAALPYFREQGNGVLINVSSVTGKVGQPYTSAYTTTKFGIVGLSECLRQEMGDTDIHVCTVLPASIDSRSSSTVPTTLAARPGRCPPSTRPRRSPGPSFAWPSIRSERSRSAARAAC